MAKRATLLLNSTYEPLQVIPWQRAIILGFTQKVETLEWHDEDSIKTVRGDIPVPAVARLHVRAPWRRESFKFTKQNVFSRDGHVCQYCGKREHGHYLTFDHVMPRSRGGKTSWDNIVTACLTCNQSKGDRTPDEAEMGLLSEPKKPIWSSNNIIMRVQDRPTVWDKYIW